ncbi:MAG: hypothetical protein JWR69_77, partial [Pedosphaera sp.]|nr:hypothetical protein [Pedosphaera sp.]
MNTVKILLCLLCLSAGSAFATGPATVYFPMARFTGAPLNRQITVRLQSDPLAVNATLVSGAMTLQPTNGYATNTFVAGNYLVSIDGLAKTLLMPVPDGTNTYNAV